MRGFKFRDGETEPGTNSDSADYEAIGKMRGLRNKIRYKKRIILAEDNYGVRENLTERLKIERYEVYAAIEGQEALELIGKQAPDILITDFDMPVMNGLELVNELERQGYNFPVIVYTSTNIEYLKGMFKYKNIQFNHKNDTEGLLEKLKNC